MKIQITITSDDDGVWTTWKREGHVIEEANFENSPAKIAEHLKATFLSETAKHAIKTDIERLVNLDQDDLNLALAHVVEDVYDLHGIVQKGYETALDHVHELYDGLLVLHPTLFDRHRMETVTNT